LNIGGGSLPFFGRIIVSTYNNHEISCIFDETVS